MIQIKRGDQLIKITFKEFLARLWPWGKWKVIYKHCINGRQHSDPVDKLSAVNTFYAFEDLTYMKTVGIEKVGGKFHGTRYKPSRPRSRQTEEEKAF